MTIISWSSAYLELMNITKDEPEVELICEDEKIMIKKVVITILKNVSYKDMKKFVLDNMESIYNVKNVLMDEVNDIGNKCMSVFEIYEIIKHVK
ncbi:hypothetical protein [uncultured Clostridium sp.]|uniref:hypothetical protein n=1 Tax=uncultured Clostridium sp. TaxID=59620 RepID=UPI0025D2CE3F|nr:hypothetical protein [uncultured Clostridium sp.]